MAEHIFSTVHWCAFFGPCRQASGSYISLTFCAHWSRVGVRQCATPVVWGEIVGVSHTAIWCGWHEWRESLNTNTILIKNSLGISSRLRSELTEIDCLGSFQWMVDMRCDPWFAWIRPNLIFFFRPLRSQYGVFLADEWCALVVTMSIVRMIGLWFKLAWSRRLMTTNLSASLFDLVP